jgi:hypothetical protein
LKVYKKYWKSKISQPTVPKSLVRQHKKLQSGLSLNYIGANGWVPACERLSKGLHKYQQKTLLGGKYLTCRLPYPSRTGYSDIMKPLHVQNWKTSTQSVFYKANNITCLKTLKFQYIIYQKEHFASYCVLCKLFFSV